MDPQVVCYSERPELWDAISGLSDEVWPEYNQHGAALNQYWGQLYDVFPAWQFVLYDPGEPQRPLPRHSHRAVRPLDPPRRGAVRSVVRVHTRMGARIGPAIPKSLHITGAVAEWESWTRMEFPETGDYVFPGRPGDGAHRPRPGHR